MVCTDRTLSALFKQYGCRFYLFCLMEKSGLLERERDVFIPLFEKASLEESQNVVSIKFKMYNLIGS